MKFVKVGHISIYLDADKFYLSYEIVRNKNVLETGSRIFDALDDKKISQLMRGFLEQIYEKITYAYVSTFSLSEKQGIIFSSEDPIYEVGLNPMSIATINPKKHYEIFLSKKEISGIQKLFGSIYGVDYIFPFESIMENLYKNRQDTASAHIVMLKDYVFLSIFFEQSLAFSAHFVFAQEEKLIMENEELSLEAEEDTQDDISLDDEFGDLDKVVDFGDIDNLDDFVAEEDETQEGDSGSEEIVNMQNEDEIKRDLVLFDFLKKSFNAYYKNNEYRSDFIVDVCIYETLEINSAIQHFIKETLAIDSKKETIKVGSMLCELSKSEVNYAK